MHTDFIMTAWKSRVRAGTSNPRIKIPKAQISIIQQSIDAYIVEESGHAIMYEDE